METKRVSARKTEKREIGDKLKPLFCGFCGLFCKREERDGKVAGGGVGLGVF